MSLIKFSPWIGSEFRRQEIRLLLLGESHHAYEDEGVDEQLTRLVVECYINATSHEPWHDYFSKLSRLVRGRDYPLNHDSKEKFWNSVSFYNYIQEIVDDHGHGARPTPDMWSTAMEPFGEVVRLLKPTHVIVTGVDLWWHVSGGKPFADTDVVFSWEPSEAVTIRGCCARAIGIVHPSGGMSYDREGGRVASFLRGQPV